MRNFLRSAAGFLSLLIVLFSVNPAYAVTWEETQPAGDTTKSWTPVALSSDGQIMMAGVQNGRLYISKNGGTSWSETQPFVGEDDFADWSWYPISMSSNGQVIVAGILNGRIYLSTNGADSWSEIQPGGDDDFDWYTISMSSNGQTILVGDHSGRLYRSTNTGSSWTEVQPAGDVDQQWRSSAVSSDGELMFAGTDGEKLYRSTDGGDNWTIMEPAPELDHQWSALAIASDSQTVIAANRYRIYRSTDGGDNSTEMQPAGDNERTWNSASISADGLFMFVTDQNRLYISTDGGNSWDETQPVGDTNQSWGAVAVSGNSRVLITNIYDGRVYLGSNPAPVTSSDNNNSVYHPPAGFGPPSCNDSSPAGVPNLFRMDAAGTYVNLYFSTVSGSTGYNVNYGLAPAANQLGDLFSYSGNAWTYGRTISGLQPNTTYYFKVQAVNGCNAGAWGQIVSVKTKSKSSVLSQWFANLAK